MPSLETPPNPAPVLEPPPSPTSKVAAGRFGALDHSEIVHLLSTLDDEVARARFRESVYISLIVCLALAWFAFFGPRVLFHQGRLVVPGESQRNKNEMTYLEVPKDLSKLVPPKSTKVISDQNHVAQTAHPTPKPPTPQELQAMRKAGAPGPPAPRPLPATPQPQPQPQPQQAQPRPQPQPAPQPQRPAQANNNIPDAPRPSQAPGKPNFATPTNPGQSISQAAHEAAEGRGQGGDNGLSAPRAHAGANTGVEVLSDTLGTDFGPYIRRLLRSTQSAWEPLIPEECYPPISKTGMTLIRFTILPDGTLAPRSMHLDDSTRDVAIDKAAWGSITSQGKFPPLPATFKGPYLELRIQFNIVHDGSSAR